VIPVPHAASRPASSLENERGFALAVAVFALAVIAALVASIFFAGRLEQQSGRSTLYSGQAREAAEAGLAEALASVPSGTLEGIPLGASLDLGTSSVGEGVITQSQVSRLTSRLFLIRAQGKRQDAAGAPLAVRSLGLLVQVEAVAAGPAEEPGRVVRVVDRGWAQLY
jgi:hypothetical protein